MGKIITIKNNKAGVGKSWITLQIGHALTLLEKDDETPYKILLLTSDPQNDILKFSGYRDSKIEKNLNDFIKTGEFNEIRLREHLFFIPLEEEKFTETFKDKLKISLEYLKEDFDFILIDSVPYFDVDKDFVEISDNIVVPTYLDENTCKEMQVLIKEIKKIIMIIPNRYTKSKKTDLIYHELKDLLSKKKIFLPPPIKQSSYILNLLENGKTIWDTKSMEVEETQGIFYQIAIDIISKNKKF